MDDVLSLEIVAANGKAEFFVRGELDLASRLTFESALRRLLTHSVAETITLDLAELTFCDGAGLHAFAAAQREGVERHKTLVLAIVRPAVAAVFDAVQFGRTVPIQPWGGAAPHP